LIEGEKPMYNKEDSNSTRRAGIRRLKKQANHDERKTNDE
jgi:hypothetical protein